MNVVNYFNLDGFPDAARDSNFNENYCIKLSDYGYNPTSKPYSEKI